MTLSGRITANDKATLETAVQALVAAHTPGVFRKLREHSDAGFLFARVVHFNYSRTKFLYQDWEAGLECAPYWHADAETSVNLSTSDPVAVANAGAVDALPRITISVSAAPANSTVTITNTTTGKSFQLRPNATGIYTAYTIVL